MKDYLQRRYLEQMDEQQTGKEALTKSLSLDLSAIQSKTSSITQSSSQRGLFERDTTIDMDDTERVSFSIDQVADEEDESPSFRYSYSKPSTKKQVNHLLLPYNPSSEQEHEKRTSFSGGIPLPPTPYSASSDPGPFRSPWFNTPTSTFNFRFPQGQEQIIASAQGSIAQLSTLTKMLCNESSVFTPISPRYKTIR